jgi:hypothetical protein
MVKRVVGRCWEHAVQYPAAHAFRICSSRAVSQRLRWLSLGGHRQNGKNAGGAPSTTTTRS